MKDNKLQNNPDNKNMIGGGSLVNNTITLSNEINKHENILDNPSSR